MSDVGRVLSLATIACALGLLSAAVVAALSAAHDGARRHAFARYLSYAAAAPLLLLLGRGPAQPMVAFAAAAALAGPQPVALALAAGAAVLAAVAPTTGVGSMALLLGGAAAGIAAHTLGRSASAHIAAGRGAAGPAVAAALAACALVLTLPERGLVTGLLCVAALAAALLLAASAWPRSAKRDGFPRARLLGEGRSVATSLALVAATAVLRSAASVTGIPTTTSPAPGALVAIAGLLAVAAIPLARDGIHGDPEEEEQAGTVLSRLVVVLALLATLAAGVEGWMRAGTYVTPLARRFLAAALAALAASETPVWRGAARALALAALLLAVLR